MKQNLNALWVTIIVYLIASSTSLQAQADKKNSDLEAIRSMAGCYEVEFKYAETFAPSEDYEKSKNYATGALEWVEIAEDTGSKVVLQHILIVRDTMIIKHWRQDWVYEDTCQYRYHRDKSWLYEPMAYTDVEGKWTQNVYQVDDSPRYSGTATWTHVDGVSSWYHKADSPLPRREYTKRSDYNVMKRGNRILIHDDKWVHEQDNDKVIRSDSSDIVLAQEKGYNTYTKIDDARCTLAQEYWKENHNMWSDVRHVWNGVLDKRKNLNLRKSVNDKKLYEHLFFSDQKWTKENLDTLINSYVSPQPLTR